MDSTASDFTKWLNRPIRRRLRLPSVTHLSIYFLLTISIRPAVSGRIALIKDSGLASGTFFDICNNAALNGAVGVILISTTTNPTAVRGLIPCAIVSPSDGEILIDAISSTDNNAVDPPNGAVSELPIRMNPFLNNVFVGRDGELQFARSGSRSRTGQA